MPKRNELYFPLTKPKIFLTRCTYLVRSPWFVLISKYELEVRKINFLHKMTYVLLLNFNSVFTINQKLSGETTHLGSIIQN